MKNWPEPKLLAELFISTLQISLTWLAKDFPLSTNKAKSAKVRSGISFITRFAKNLSALVNMAKDAEIGNDGGNGNNGNDKIGPKITFV